MKSLKILFTIFFFMVFLFGCQEDDYEVGDLIAPTNINITPVIIGADLNNPNGDGSGMVEFTATADNAISFQYLINGERILAPEGKGSYVFAELNTNTYTVTAVAYGVGGISSSKSINIDVFSSFEDQVAKNLLSGGIGNSKTWYWAADKPGNIGLGPNTVQSGGEHTWSQWFTSTAWHADKLCMYDAEFVFSQPTEGELLYEQTKGLAYTPGDFAASIGVAGESCYGADIVPALNGVKQVTMIPSSSIATIDGNYRGTTMSISDNGFMSWYVGVSKLEIIKLTADALFIRITDSANPANAWYCKYQTAKPVQ